jgi:hypothetical protein
MIMSSLIEGRSNFFLRTLLSVTRLHTMMFLECSKNGEFFKKKTKRSNVAVLVLWPSSRGSL